MYGRIIICFEFALSWPFSQVEPLVNNGTLNGLNFELR